MDVHEDCGVDLAVPDELAFVILEVWFSEVVSNVLSDGRGVLLHVCRGISFLIAGGAAFPLAPGVSFPVIGGVSFPVVFSVI